MIKISETAKRIIISMTAISLIFLGIGIFFINNQIAYAKGIIFGTVFSILKLLLLERTINKSLDMSKSGAQNYARAHYMLRYLLTGVVLAVGALEPSISLLGVIIGIFCMRPAVYAATYIEKKQNSENANADIGK